MPTTLGDALSDTDVPTLGARLGYAGKALLYVALAVLIGQMTMRGASQETSATGAIDALARQPFGTALLLVLAAGLVAHGAHAAWSIVTSDDKGLNRWSNAGRAVVYLGLGALAVGKVLGASSGSGGGSTESSMTATVLNWPGGTWLVTAVGLGIIAAGAAKLYRSVTAKWQDEFERHHVSPGEHAFIRRTGQVGHLARAVAYGLVGGFVVYAATTHDPDKSAGLDGALGEVTQLSVAPFVLVPLALGMLAYALFAAMMARYVRAE